MKITDVSITLFSWDDIPQTSYGEHKKFGGSSQLGLLAIDTDEGITGHAFLGSSRNAADIDAPGLIRYLKPVLMGQDPLARERLYQALWKRARTTTTRAVGAIDVALWDIAGKAANMPIHKLLGSYRERAPAYASSQILASPALPGA
jgi:L-alanine-DL-glutamate epimerase-like enolase superfamily enzyme